jgi:hypothetical protein
LSSANGENLTRQLHFPLTHFKRFRN